MHFCTNLVRTLDHAPGAAPERPNLTVGLDNLREGYILVALDLLGQYPAVSRAERNQTKGRSKTLPLRPWASFAPPFAGTG